MVRVEAMEPRLLLSAFDDTFGLLGKAKLDIDGLGDQGMWVQAQADGKLLVSGTAAYRLTADAPQGNVASESRRFMARLNRDGTLDSTFGTGGVIRFATLSFGFSVITTLAVQGDGKVLVGGSATEDPVPTTPPAPAPVTPTAFAVARYNVDGTVDSAFGQQGVARVRVLSAPEPSSSETVAALSVQPDGKIVAAGNVLRPHQANGTSSSDGDIGVVRLNSDGSVDETFGRRVLDSGTADNPRYDTAGVVRVQGDGKVLVGGQVDPWGDSGGFGLIRYNPDGTRDGGFGQDGKVTTVFPKPAGDNGAGRGTVEDLFTQPDGKIVAVGRVTENHYGLARYNADGTLDTSFGGKLLARGVQGGVYRLAYRPESGAIDVAGLGTGEVIERRSEPGWIDEEVRRRPTGLQAYAARFASDGSFLSAARAENLPFTGDERVVAAAIQPDGKIVGVGIAYPTAYAGEQPDVYAQTADALVVRIDPAELTPEAPPVVVYRSIAESISTPVVDPGNPATTLPEVVRMSGKPVIRGGRSYPFRITYAASEAVIRQTPVMATGPNFRADAQLVKVKAPRPRGAGAATVRPAVATYRLSAPGGTFKFSDNGKYGILVGASAASSSSTMTFRVAGSFTIATPVPRAGRRRTAAPTTSALRQLSAGDATPAAATPTATRLVESAAAAGAGGKRDERAHVPQWSR